MNRERIGTSISTILDCLKLGSDLPEYDKSLPIEVALHLYKDRANQAIARSTKLASDELDRFSRMQAPEATSFYPTARLLEAYARGLLIEHWQSSGYDKVEQIVDEEIRRLELPPCEFGRQSAVLITHHVALALRVEFKRNPKDMYYVMARYHQLAGLLASKAASGQGDSAARHELHSNYLRGVFQNWMEKIIGTPNPASIALLSVDGLTGSLIKCAKYLQQPLRVEVYSMPQKPSPMASGAASGVGVATA